MKADTQKKTNAKANVKKISPEEKKTLIIVDVQNDFANPDGALYVPGGENVSAAIIDYVNKNKDYIETIVFTRDWHKKKDESFQKNGGEWPMHCVQNTEGAEIVKDLYSALLNTRLPVKIVDKGTVFDHEEYGAFEHCGTFHHLFPNKTPVVSNCFFSNVESSSGCRITTENLIVCGIAGDYCVKETIKNLLGHWKKFKIEVLMDGTASIDGGTALEELIVERNLKKI